MKYMSQVKTVIEKAAPLIGPIVRNGVAALALAGTMARAVPDEKLKGPRALLLGTAIKVGLGPTWFNRSVLLGLSVPLAAIEWQKRLTHG